MVYDGFIFDNDGTLYEMPSGFKVSVINCMIEHLSKTLSVSKSKIKRERNRLIEKYGLESTVYVFNKEYDINMNDFTEKVFSPFLSKDLKELGIIPNAKLANLLESITVPKVVLTNNSSAFARHILQQVGIAHTIDKIIGESEMDYKIKPQTYAYKAGLKEIQKLLGHQPTNVLMVEDVSGFLVPAKELGITTVLVGEKHLEKPAHVDYIINDIVDLGKIINDNAGVNI